MMLLFLRLVARLPVPVLYGMGSLLSFLLYHVFRYRLNTVRSNILRAFPERDADWRLALERRFYRYLGELVAEILVLSRLTPAELAARVEIIGLEHLQACVENSESSILLSAHQGNWEWMLAAVASVSPCQLDALYRPLHNPLMDVFFMQLRTRWKANMIPADKAARAILKLRREVRTFGILGDQNPRRKDEKYWATFMGVDTPVAIGPERIARLTGYPAYYVTTDRLARGRYRCTIALLASSPYGEEGDISQRYMAAVEAQLRCQPECWMWSHRRWRYRREDCPVAPVT